MNVQQSAQERRQFKRVPYGAWVEDMSQVGSLRFYLSRNLSKGGLLLENQAGPPPPIGSKVRLRLVVENEEHILTVDGTVVRHGADPTGSALFAVQFQELDSPSVTFLQTLVTELGRAQPLS